MKTFTRKRLASTAALTMAATLAFSACSDDSEDSDTAEDNTTENTTASTTASDSTTESGDACADITIENQFVRLPPAENTALYFDVTNGSDAKIALTGASSTIAGTYELHEVVDVNGEMTMQKISSGQIEVPAGETTNLEPGGLHVMAIGLTTELAEGDSTEWTLTFDNDCELDIEAEVTAVEESGSMGNGMGDSQ